MCGYELRLHVLLYVVSFEEESEDDREESEDDREESEEEEEEEEEGEEDTRFPTLRQRRAASSLGLEISMLENPLYPEYSGREGPYYYTNPHDNNSLDYLMLLWPESLVDELALETNRYARSRTSIKNWSDVDRDEIWTFLGVNILMAIHRLPTINCYWSGNRFLGVPALQEHMSRARFWKLWVNFHVVDNRTISPGDSVDCKIKPVLEVLGKTFVDNYSPSQELSVDEAMVKYKGHCRGKVRMPKKPIKLGFKIWCCSCSCCGYLCTFQVYDGMPTDKETGKKVPEKGMVKRVVLDLVSPYEGVNHVVYMDNFFTSGPLVEELAKKGIYVVGSIQQRAAGFPDSLKGVKLEKGSYVAEKVNDICYYVFSDRKVVSFVSNVFPEHMSNQVARVRLDGTFGFQSVPPVLPAYNKYMGAVDRLSQLKRNYGFDRKSRRYWLRIFFQFLDYAITNSYLLYAHNCKHYGTKPVKQLQFRLDLVELLLRKTRRRKRPAPNSDSDHAVGVCSLERVCNIGLARGRCIHCINMKRKPHYTSFGCSHCKVRLCKIPCFEQYHRIFN